MFLVLFAEKVQRELSIRDRFHLALTSSLGWNDGKELHNNLKPLLSDNTTVFFLDADIAVFHTDSVFASIKYMPCRKSNNRLDGYIHTSLKSFPFPWFSKIIDIRFFMNLRPETMAGELTNNMKSALCDRGLNSSADISDEVSSFRLGNTGSESVFCYFNTTNMTSIFRFTDNNGCGSISEITFITYTIVNLDDIA